MPQVHQPSQPLPQYPIEPSAFDPGFVVDSPPPSLQKFSSQEGDQDMMEVQRKILE
jgi:hypothetical protein